MTTTDDTATPDAPPARRRRARRTDGDPGPAPRRARRTQSSGEDLLAELTTQVDRLIAENQELAQARHRSN